MERFYIVTNDGKDKDRKITRHICDILKRAGKTCLLAQKEVADLLGISQSYISRLEKKIMKRLKKEIVRFE